MLLAPYNPLLVIQVKQSLAVCQLKRRNVPGNKIITFFFYPRLYNLFHVPPTNNHFEISACLVTVIEVVGYSVPCNPVSSVDSICNRNIHRPKYDIFPVMKIPSSVQIFSLLIIQGTTQPDEFSM